MMSVDLGWENMSHGEGSRIHLLILLGWENNWGMSCIMSRAKVSKVFTDKNVRKIIMSCCSMPSCQDLKVFATNPRIAWRLGWYFVTVTERSLEKARKTWFLCLWFVWSVSYFILILSCASLCQVTGFLHRVISVFHVFTDFSPSLQNKRIITVHVFIQQEQSVSEGDSKVLLVTFASSPRKLLKHRLVWLFFPLEVDEYLNLRTSNPVLHPCLILFLSSVAPLFHHLFLLKMSRCAVFLCCTLHPLTPLSARSLSSAILVVWHKILICGSSLGSLISRSALFRHFLSVVFKLSRMITRTDDDTIKNYRLSHRQEQRMQG